MDIDRHLVSTIKRTDVVGFGLAPLLDYITIGFDQSQGHIPRFLVLLHYQTSKSPGNWTEIARMDHNETPNQGHDVYQEGLHVDIARRSERAVHLQIRHGPLPSNRGVIRERASSISVTKQSISSMSMKTGALPAVRPGGLPTEANRYTRL